MNMRNTSSHTIKFMSIYLIMRVSFIYKNSPFTYRKINFEYLDFNNIKLTLQKMWLTLLIRTISHSYKTTYS